jgi:hypothetical protein
MRVVGMGWRSRGVIRGGKAFEYLLLTIGITLQFSISCNLWFPTPGSIAGLIGLLRQHSQFAAHLVLLWVYGQGFCCQQ